jgi:hypothetical protein
MAAGPIVSLWRQSSVSGPWRRVVHVVRVASAQLQTTYLQPGQLIQVRCGRGQNFIDKCRILSAVLVSHLKNRILSPGFPNGTVSFVLFTFHCLVRIAYADHHIAEHWERKMCRVELVYDVLSGGSQPEKGCARRNQYKRCRAQDTALPA